MFFSLPSNDALISLSIRHDSQKLLLLVNLRVIVLWILISFELAEILSNIDLFVGSFVLNLLFCKIH